MPGALQIAIPLSLKADLNTASYGSNKQNHETNLYNTCQFDERGRPFYLP